MAVKPIVAATDGSEESLRAVDWAAREAALRDAPLRIVSASALLPHMSGGHDVSGYDTVADVITEHRDAGLAAAVERAAKAAPGLLIDADRLQGAPAQAVSEAGAGALMLVVGSRGSGAFAALILGSVSRYVATHAPCPVVVVREETSAARRQVGIGIARAEGSGPALAFAFEEAALRQASLVVVHGLNLSRSETGRAGELLAAPGLRSIEEAAIRTLNAVISEWQAKYPGVAVTQDVVRGHPGRALAGLSARTDLVVLGRHQVHHGPGAVMHAVLNHAHGPIATVPTG